LGGDAVAVAWAAAVEGLDAEDFVVFVEVTEALNGIEGAEWGAEGVVFTDGGGEGGWEGGIDTPDLAVDGGFERAAF
jgi:hypothetical protein